MVRRWCMSWTTISSPFATITWVTRKPWRPLLQLWHLKEKRRAKLNSTV
jgi:hypothetical protein